MPKVSWHWHRLWAMSPGEMSLHARKKVRQFIDARRLPDWPVLKLEGSGAFPRLPKHEDAPKMLREALKRDVENILAGRWEAFGHLDLKVDDPPKWHCDYLVGKDLVTTESAFKLNYRELPGGADIKLIWELSRWHQLARLAMAAHVLRDKRAARKCIEWLEDWVKRNPPYRGWNWTSALEVGMRLIQFTWIDALLCSSSRREEPQASKSEIRNPKSEIDQSLLTSAATIAGRLERLRQEILPAHVWYAWRHKSFGSSANNHLLGELAGLILATVRWPALAKWGASLDELQSRWEHEVLAQFAEDGGNREQALNYHLFSWELCWQAQMALEALGRRVSPLTSQRLSFAGRFFWEVQARCDHWDYGDSDNAFVTPFFMNIQRALQEWHCWFENPESSPALYFWCGSPLAPPPPLKRGKPLNTIERGDWWVYPDTGLAICESGFWWLRWDLSPLGFSATAAHGHLDALHLSIWLKGVALVIDPGTGAYYADSRLRGWLASRAAHNGPCPAGEEQPRRLGPFLWAAHHLVPRFRQEGPAAVGVLNLSGLQLRRRIEHSVDGLGWQVEDQCLDKDGSPVPFAVRWQFAPGSWLKKTSERKFSLNRADVSVVIEMDDNWTAVELVEPLVDQGLLTSGATGPLEGIVSPAFRKVCRAPYLQLVARPAGDKPCVFRTTFLACAHA